MADTFACKVPRYECLIELSKRYPVLNPAALVAFFSLVRTSDEVLKIGNEFFARHNISKGRFVVLILLSDEVQNQVGSKTPAELAEMAGCTRATMTGLIDSLERDGLVRREPDAQDRRMMRVVLTEAGRSLIETMLPQHFQQVTHMMSGLNDEELKTLSSLLEKIVGRCSDLGPLSSGSSGAADKGAS
jgi:DNA-binding MarR family transcriptional regulator